jgi:hypothetical protein
MRPTPADLATVGDWQVGKTIVGTFAQRAVFGTQGPPPKLRGALTSLALLHFWRKHEPTLPVDEVMRAMSAPCGGARVRACAQGMLYQRSGRFSTLFWTRWELALTAGSWPGASMRPGGP